MCALGCSINGCLECKMKQYGWRVVILAGMKLVLVNRHVFLVDFGDTTMGMFKMKWRWMCWDSRGLYYEAGFSLSELTSGKTLGFRSYDAGSLLTRLDLHGNLCWTASLVRSRLGSRIRDQLSESTACWPIRAQCTEFKAIKSYYRRQEIQFKLPLQERRPAKITDCVNVKINRIYAPIFRAIWLL